MPSGALGVAADDATVVLEPESERECPRAIFDDNGVLANGPEAIGELVNTAGVGSFEGYYANDEANAERTRCGWYWSGDLAYRDEAGYFYFAGRGYDWLRVDGENFAAAPVERVVLRHPDVVLAAVYAVPDPNTGDRVMVTLQLSDGTTFDPDGFAAFLDSEPDVGTKWRPTFVRVTSDMPVGHTNKIQKTALRRQAWLTHDDVWWRPSRDQGYRLMNAADVERLARAFVEAGRGALAPRPEQSDDRATTPIA
jgi:fatty-acyl-CoA synthase